ncbi:DUF4129 domain-containing protein [Agrococcus carbonis]|uniref:Protein-glutamine gamma-glutamyltransferase-like C-terminal domain-containing protein n=1 Tax=Agrococcus carbonis TaxID=684552 RepID=A0A1H1PMN3_9MICO|nr:DUF4129 domain-containing protein [Agrococcus carbonis]SDS12552.1 protein of unknown function [Agrococcus carbonis]
MWLLPASAALVSLAVVAGAALTGPWRMGELDGGPPSAPSETTAPTQTPSAETPPPGDPIDTSQPVSWFVVLVVALVAIVVAAVLLRLIRGAARARIRDVASTTRPTTDHDVAEAGEPDLPALRQGVDAARAVLAERDDADDAIIAAWLALEAAAADSGVHRAPAATPTEFTASVLRSTHADADTIRTLLGLFHRARFARSDRMTRGDVDEARRCLERLAGH